MAANPVSLHFGIGAEMVDDDLKAMLESSHPKHPSTMQDQMDTMLAYVEQMQVTTRDNNAILHQLMRTMEERINVKIENLRTEMIELIEKKQSEGQLGSPFVGASTKTKARRASVQDVKHKAEKYNINDPPMSPPRVEAYYEMVDINPHPGFVVKTRKLIGEKNKVFINIFHHELIALTPPGLTADKAKDKPYMMMEAPTTTVDHAGVSCMTFNVGISSEYFQLPNPNIDINITAPATIYKLIHKVNLKFNEFLDEGNYSIPRLANGYKGESPPVFKVPQLKDPGEREKLKVTRSMNDMPVRRASDGAPGTSNGANGHLAHANSDPPRSNGIAGVWAATESTDDGDTLAPLPGDADYNTTNGHNSGHGAGPQRRGSENNDNDSVMSDITTSSAQPAGNKPARRSSLAAMVGLGGSANNLHDHSHGRKITRKSVLPNPAAAGYNGGAIAGRNLLSGDMLEYVQNENVSTDEAQELKNTASEDPSVLLGWQIWFQGDGADTNTNTIYVVTDVRKNFLSKTEFRLSRFKEDDQWVKLKRQEGKSGAEFRPMRKVLFGLSVDDETVM